jgi:putative peptidoglycan binding protein
MTQFVFFKAPPLSAVAFNRLRKAAENSPPLQLGEPHNEAVKALQQGLIALFDLSISIPSGPTGNYLRETEAAVRAFQAKFHLLVDGIAGKETITALDVELDRRSREVLDSLDRCINGCKPCWFNDAERLRILHEMEANLRAMKASNTLGFANAAAAVVLLVILFFAVLMFLSIPQNQKALQRLMSEVIDAFRVRGEVLQAKIEEIKKEIKKFLDDAREVRSDCERDTALTDPAKLQRCKNLHAGQVKAAFEALIVVMRNVSTVIVTGLQGESVGLRGLKPLFGREALVALAEAFKRFINALNDFFKCLGCPEIPFPVIPDFPLFP